MPEKEIPEEINDHLKLYALTRIVDYLIIIIAGHGLVVSSLFMFQSVPCVFRFAIFCMSISPSIILVFDLYVIAYIVQILCQFFGNSFDLV